MQAAQPCTVRHVYYLGLGRLWEKDAGKSRRNYSVPTGETRPHGKAAGWSPSVAAST
ncbi:hypothetical protein ACFQ2B_00415 [Streptomyces stramineus]|uniref:Uncharacterized protein n=1 Tax=Streptomyces stramineus TaxID=173861 RepID=A0ABP3JA12_9ACTN